MRNPTPAAASEAVMFTSASASQTALATAFSLSDSFRSIVARDVLADPRTLKLEEMIRVSREREAMVEEDCRGDFERRLARELSFMMFPKLRSAPKQLVR